MVETAWRQNFYFGYAEIVSDITKVPSDNVRMALGVTAVFVDVRVQAENT